LSPSLKISILVIHLFPFTKRGTFSPILEA
jgi:hypothetical protein